MKKWLARMSEDNYGMPDLFWQGGMVAGFGYALAELGERPDLIEKIGVFIAMPVLGLVIGALIGMVATMLIPSIRKRN